MTPLQPYVLVTPARNEAQFISRTIESVIAQTLRPLRWVIVSDGSTDGTDEIVERYVKIHPWIELLRMPPREQRHFAGKVGAFNAGFERLTGVAYEAIGSIDADISFGQDHFRILLTKLAEDDTLGLAGAPFAERGQIVYDYRVVGIDHVSGCCQLFRKQCFEDIGGYVPMEAGGIDFVAVITARMKGWKTRTFLESPCQHHRAMGTAERGRLHAQFRAGVKDYLLGSHPLWQVSRTIYQMGRQPYVIGGLLLGAGYLWAYLSGKEVQVPADLKDFRRREQMTRLKSTIGRRVGGLSAFRQS